MQLPSTWSWSTWWWRSSTWPLRRSSLNPRRTRTSLRSWSTSKDQPENWLDWSKSSWFISKNISFPKTRAAVRELPKYKKDTGEENDASGGQEDDSEKKPLSDEFSEKTNQLLDYIEKTYLQGIIESDPQGKNIIEKMKLDNSQKVLIFMQKHDPSFIICIYCLQAKAMETGFDNIFGEGPTPSHSAMAGERDMQQVKEKSEQNENEKIWISGGTVCWARDGWGQSEQRGWDECLNLSRIHRNLSQKTRTHFQKLFEKLIT